MTLTAHLTAMPSRISEGESFRLLVTLSDDTGATVDYRKYEYNYSATDEENSNASALAEALNGNKDTTTFNEVVIEFFPRIRHGNYVITVAVTGPSELQLPPATTQIHVNIPMTQAQANVTLHRTFAARTNDIALGPAIRNRTSAVGYARYAAFIDCIFDCKNPADQSGSQIGRILQSAEAQRLPCVDKGIDLQINIHGPYAYNVLKLATQAFLTLESGVVIRDFGKPKIFDIDRERARFSDPSLSLGELKARLEQYLVAPSGRSNTLPYLDRIVDTLISLDAKETRETLPYCHGILQHRMTSPTLIELIWSYWHEEGMLVQTMNAIARRFQNQRSSSDRDPLGELEIDPLRPLNNMIWGFIQDEQQPPHRAAPRLRI